MRFVELQLCYRKIVETLKKILCFVLFVWQVKKVPDKAPIFETNGHLKTLKTSILKLRAIIRNHGKGEE